MIWLILSIVFSVSFFQSMHLSQKMQLALPKVVTINYFVAATLSLAALFITQSPASATAVICGATTGTLYSLHIWISLVCFKRIGVGITTAVASMSIMLPILISWFFWEEEINTLQIVALALCPVALFLLRKADSTADQHSDKKPKDNAWLWLMLNFLGAGLIWTSHKAFTRYGTPEGSVAYQSALFVVAATICGLSAIIQHKKHHGPSNSTNNMKKVWLVGSIIGVINIGATLFSVYAINAIEAVIVFPTQSCSIIILNLIISAYCWHEQLIKRQWLGVVMALGIVLLTNL